MNLKECLQATLLAVLPPLSAGAVDIENAYARTMETADFQRISEFFTGHEVSGNRVILRSDAAERDGQYFILELTEETSSFPAEARIVLEVIPSDRNNLETFSFSIPAGTDPSRYLYLGITGDDWPGEDIKPLAWRVQVLDNAETVLVEWKSFLWEMP